MTKKEKTEEKKAKTERIVISRGRKTDEVVYRTKVGTRRNGKAKYTSFTKHEKKGA